MSEEPRRYRDEKDDRNEKEEKNRNESWDEKWRRDPVDGAVWALILIWVGLVWLANNAGWLKSFVESDKVWAFGFIGAGIIVLLGVVLRLVVPAYRRPVIGSLIFGVILFGIGLTQFVPDIAIGAIILIGIGLVILLGGIFRKR
jgi:hypothetical protein